jgi:hypothetical protein
MEAKFGPLDKKDKKRLTTNEMKFFRTAGNTLLSTKEMKKFWKS